MYRLDEYAGIRRIHARGDAVAEVEYMTATLAITGKNTLYLCTDGLGVGIQYRGVHVALQSNLGTHSGTGHTNIHGPVQANTIGATISDAFQPQPAILGKHDNRHATTFVLTNQAAD